MTCRWHWRPRVFSSSGRKLKEAGVEAKVELKSDKFTEINSSIDKSRLSDKVVAKKTPAKGGATKLKRKHHDSKKKKKHGHHGHRRKTHHGEHGDKVSRNSA